MWCCDNTGPGAAVAPKAMLAYGGGGASASTGTDWSAGGSAAGAEVEASTLLAASDGSSSLCNWMQTKKMEWEQFIFNFI